MADWPVSIHIGERYITVADITRHGRQYAVNTLGFEEHPVNVYKSDAPEESAVIAVLIQKLIRDAGVKKKPVNVVIPDTYSYSQIIEMPLLTEKELLSAIKYQADQLIPVPIDQVNLDIEILFEDKKNRKLSLFLVACPNSMIDKIVESIEASGLAPNAVENEMSAVLRLISDTAGLTAQSAAVPSISLYINFGYSSTSLCLFHNVAKIPLQIHNFSLGYNIFLKDIQANFNTSEADTKKLLAAIGFSRQQQAYHLESILSSPLTTIVSEIERFIVAGKTRFNAPINGVFLFGEGFGIHSFEKKLSASLGMTVNFYDLYSYLVKNNVADFFKTNLPLFVPAAGAALRL